MAKTSALFNAVLSWVRWWFSSLGSEQWGAVSWGLRCLIPFLEVFISVTAQGTGAGHHFHWCPAALLVVCSGVAAPAPALRRRLELKLLPGSLLHRCMFLSDIHYFFKHGRKVYFGFPKNVRAGFGLLFPVSSYLGVGDGSLFLFVFLNGILAPLLLWFSDSLHILCSRTPLVTSSLLPGRAVKYFYMGLFSDFIVKENICSPPYDFRETGFRNFLFGWIGERCDVMELLWC